MTGHCSYCGEQACECGSRPVPRWTTTPPTEPGWYWTRYHGNRFDACGPEPVYYDANTSGDWDDVIEEAALEWWPIPIPEPPREE